MLYLIVASLCSPFIPSSLRKAIWETVTGFHTLRTCPVDGNHRWEKPTAKLVFLIMFVVESLLHDHTLKCLFANLDFQFGT